MEPEGTLPAESRFGLRDAMILIAAIAIGIAPARFAVATLNSSPFMHPRAYDRVIFYGMLHATPILVVLTSALLTLALIQPGASLRRLVNQSGYVVAMAGLIGAGFSAAYYACLAFWGPAAGQPRAAERMYMHATTTGMPDEVGLLVLGAFVCVTIQGRLHPGSSWRERAAWLAALSWVVAMVLTRLRLFL